jgi:hypothetical protein
MVGRPKGLGVLQRSSEVTDAEHLTSTLLGFKPWGLGVLWEMRAEPSDRLTG